MADLSGGCLRGRVRYTLTGEPALNDPAAYTPSMEIYCSSAQPWFHADTERKRFAKMPG